MKRILVFLVLACACNPDKGDTDTTTPWPCEPCDVDDECAVGFKCVDSLCAPRCALESLHDPPGKTCPAGECVDDNDGDDIGVCRDGAGVPICGSWEAP